MLVLVFLLVACILTFMFTYSSWFYRMPSLFAVSSGLVDKVGDHVKLEGESNGHNKIPNIVRRRQTMMATTSSS